MCIRDRCINLYFFSLFWERSSRLNACIIDDLHGTDNSKILPIPIYESKAGSRTKWIKTSFQYGCYWFLIKKLFKFLQYLMSPVYNLLHHIYKFGYHPDFTFLPFISLPKQNSVWWQTLFWISYFIWQSKKKSFNQKHYNITNTDLEIKIDVWREF